MLLRLRFHRRNSQLFWLCGNRRQVDGRVVGGKEGEFRMDD